MKLILREIDREKAARYHYDVSQRLYSMTVQLLAKFSREDGMGSESI